MSFVNQAVSIKKNGSSVLTIYPSLRLVTQETSRWDAILHVEPDEGQSVHVVSKKLRLRERLRDVFRWRVRVEQNEKLEFTFFNEEGRIDLTIERDVNNELILYTDINC